ncbi:glucans biosynthesis protein C [Rubritalea halochordaticola]|uniref:Glucans biosynthesis protein C n=1 Tax=Rubritalea halochordaticola TaxID=714537 RepID=A0ABP9V044_9BACT
MLEAPTTADLVKRRHDLDALRSGAMLLGIALHAGVAYTTARWLVNDSQQSELFDIFANLVHGFRMQLFFLLSGFFTAMLYQKRGLKALVAHRFKRIFLPLVLFGAFLCPLVSWLADKSAETEAAVPVRDYHDEAKDEWYAVLNGEVEILRSYLEQGGDVNALHPEKSASLLSIAAMTGNTECVAYLLGEGAKLDTLDSDGGTPLHSAALFGREDVVSLLLEAGADPKDQNKYGYTPLDSAYHPWGVVQWLAGEYRIVLDQPSVEAGRAKVRSLLEGAGAVQNIEIKEEKVTKVDEALRWLMHGPSLHHLWFLWFLCWFLGGFALVVWLLGRFGLLARTLPEWMLSFPGCYVWLVPLTLLGQYFMSRGYGFIGPDTSTGLLPMPRVLGYYAVFFAFGALLYTHGGEKRLGRHWKLGLVIGLLVLAPVVLELEFHYTGMLAGLTWGRETISDMLQVLYAWVMVFACMGMFRQLMKHESSKVRYMSDASYWLYLMHLPLSMSVQMGMRSWDAPAWLKFLIVCAVVMIVLLPLYQWVVRYGWIGALLNGRKKPDGE